MSDTSSDQLEYTDRSTAASIMGALICVIGLACLGFAPVLLLSYFLQTAAMQDMGAVSLQEPPVAMNTTGPFVEESLEEIAAPGAEEVLTEEVPSGVYEEPEMAEEVTEIVESEEALTYDPYGDMGMGFFYYFLVSIFFCLVPGVFWLWCGIGSIKRRKYARKLIAAATTAWAVLGALYMILIVIIMVWAIQAMRDAMDVAGGGPAGGMAMVGAIMTIYMIVLCVFFVGLPLMFAIFYTRRNVMLTFDFYDEKASWTDKVPVRVLAFTLPALWLTLCGLPYSTLLFSSENPFVPENATLMGVFWLVGSAMFVVVACYMHTMKPLFWRLMIVCCLSFMAYGIAASWSMDFSSITAIQEEIPELASLYAAFDPRNMIVGVCIFWGLIIAYLVSLRSCFYRPAQPPAESIAQTT